MKKGCIYLITNKVNGKKYVGQTSRDIWTRFAEHCSPYKNEYSAIGKAIQEYGHNNFKVEIIENVDLDQLDSRERYWINYYNTYHDGYNQTLGGQGIKPYSQLRVVENGLIIDSILEFGRLAQEQVGWEASFTVKQVKKAIKKGSTFLGYHFEEIQTPKRSSEDKIRDWIITLKAVYCKKNIYCNELDMEFESIAAAANYLLENNLYQTASKTPIQSLVTSIGKQLHGKTQLIHGVSQNYTFGFLPSATKQDNGNLYWGRKRVYCPQIDREFMSIASAADYFIDQKIWVGIKKKTAKTRISDIIRGYFPEYRGYTFIVKE